MNILDTTDIFSHLSSLPDVPKKQSADERYGNFSLDTVLTCEQVKEKAGKYQDDLHIEEDYVRMTQYGMQVHGVLLDIKMDGMNRSPLVYQCSFNGHRILAYRDDEMGTDFFFLHTVDKEGMLSAYCDLLFNNTSENQTKAFFAYLSNPEAHLKEYKEKPLRMLEELKQQGYIVENIRVNNSTINITIHATITLPEGLHVLNSPTLLPSPDKDDTCYEYNRERVDKVNEDIRAHRCTFVQYWSWGKDECQWLLTTDRDYDANTREFSYKDEREHYILVCEDRIIDSVKKALTQIDKVTHSEIPTSYDFYRIIGRGTRKVGDSDVLTLSSSKRKWWMDPSQPEQTRKGPFGKIIIKEGIPRTFVTTITHFLSIAIERREEMYHVTLTEKIQESIVPAKLSLAEERKRILQERTTSYIFDRWQLLSEVARIAKLLG